MIKIYHSGELVSCHPRIDGSYRSSVDKSYYWGLIKAAKNNVSYTDFLDEILSQEVASKQEKNIALRTALAKFPYVKTLDFAFQPSIDKKRIKELGECRFIANGENVIFLGPPVSGKPTWPWPWASRP